MTDMPDDVLIVELAIRRVMDRRSKTFGVNAELQQLLLELAEEIEEVRRRR